MYSFRLRFKNFPNQLPSQLANLRIPVPVNNAEQTHFLVDDPINQRHIRKPSLGEQFRTVHVQPIPPAWLLSGILGQMTLERKNNLHVPRPEGIFFPVHITDSLAADAQTDFNQIMEVKKSHIINLKLNRL